MTPHDLLWKVFIEKGLFDKKKSIASLKYQFKHSNDIENDKLIEKCIALYNEELKFFIGRIVSLLVIIASFVYMFFIRVVRQNEVALATFLFLLMAAGLAGIVYFTVKISQLKKKNLENLMN